MLVEKPATTINCYI